MILGCCRASDLFAQRPNYRDSTPVAREYARTHHLVDSLSALGEVQFQKVEDLKKELPTGQQAKTDSASKKTASLKKEIRRAEARLDSTLVRLDSCVGAQNVLISKLAEERSHHKQPSSHKQ